MILDAGASINDQPNGELDIWPKEGGWVNFHGAQVGGVGDPTNPQDAANKQYADTKVAKAGDAMTGNLTLPGIGGSGGADLQLGTHIAANGHTIWGVSDPQNSDWVANKKYVDQAVAAGGGGGTKLTSGDTAPASPAVGDVWVRYVSKTVTFYATTAQNSSGITNVANAQGAPDDVFATATSTGHQISSTFTIPAGTIPDTATLRKVTVGLRWQATATTQNVSLNASVGDAAARTYLAAAANVSQSNEYDMAALPSVSALRGVTVSSQRTAGTGTWRYDAFWVKVEWTEASTLQVWDGTRWV